VAPGVVHLLEPVEVEHQHGERPRAALGARRFLVEAVDEQRAVGKSREHVEVREPFDAALRGALARLHAPVRHEEPAEAHDGAEHEPRHVAAQALRELELRGGALVDARGDRGVGSIERADGFRLHLLASRTSAPAVRDPRVERAAAIDLACTTSRRAAGRQRLEAGQRRIGGRALREEDELVSTSPARRSISTNASESPVSAPSARPRAARSGACAGCPGCPSRSARPAPRDAGSPRDRARERDEAQHADGDRGHQEPAPASRARLGRMRIASRPSRAGLARRGEGFLDLAFAVRRGNEAGLERRGAK
jgi:hypothetical protein